MAVANCTRCKRMFNKMTSLTVCSACQQLEEEEFERVYRYLRDHPNSSITETAVATDVAESQIMKFYQSGRLLAGDAGYPCQRCGSPTQRGVYCAKCTGLLQNQIRTGMGAASSTEAAPPKKLGRPDIKHQMRVDRR